MDDAAVRPDSGCVNSAINNDLASLGEELYIEWDSEPSVKVNMPLDLLRTAVSPD